jgi:hypothetical protein
MEIMRNVASICGFAAQNARSGVSVKEVIMTTLMKYAVAAALTGAMALAATSPSEARGGRNAAAAIGFGAGPGYYGYDDYAYEPGPAYARGYRSNLHGCLSSPASPNFNENC